jgi:hypothetical protein
MAREPDPLTVSEVVRRAVQIIDPDDVDPVAGDFERAFEDDDEPIRAAGDMEERVANVLAELDPATNNGALAMAGALTVYLSFRRDEAGMEPATLLQLAARAEWDGRPPEPVLEWLADRGIDP